MIRVRIEGTEEEMLEFMGKCQTFLDLKRHI